MPPPPRPRAQLEGEDLEIKVDYGGGSPRAGGLRRRMSKRLYGASDGKTEEVEEEGDFSLLFKVFVETMIILNAVQLGVCVHPEESEGLERYCPIAEHVFTAVFLIEVFYRLHILRCSYFQSGWNLLDLALSVVAVVDSWILSPILSGSDVPLRSFIVIRLMRLFRICRILKVLRSRRELQMLLEGLIGALASMVWVALLLGVLIYACSIVMVTLFREIDFDGFPLTFEGIPRAMFTLFTLCIVADWTDIVEPVIRDSPWAALLFIFFIILATFGILNLIIGVITERTGEVQRNHLRKCQSDRDNTKMHNIENIAEIIFSNQMENQDDDALTITQAEMQCFMETHEHGGKVDELIRGVNLPHGYSIVDCHAMFDRDATGCITKQEFVRGMKRLIFNDVFQRQCMMQSSIADVLVELKAGQKAVIHELKSGQKEIQDMISFLREGLHQLRDEMAPESQVRRLGFPDLGDGGGGGCSSTAPKPVASALSSWPSLPKVFEVKAKDAKPPIPDAGVLSLGPQMAQAGSASEDRIVTQDALKRIVEKLREPLATILCEGLHAEAFRVVAASDVIPKGDSQLYARSRSEVKARDSVVLPVAQPAESGTSARSGTVRAGTPGTRTPPILEGEVAQPAGSGTSARSWIRAGTPSPGIRTPPIPEATVAQPAESGTSARSWTVRAGLRSPGTRTPPILEGTVAQPAGSGTSARSWPARAGTRTPGTRTPGTRTPPIIEETFEALQAESTTNSEHEMIRAVYELYGSPGPQEMPPEKDVMRV